VKEGQRAEGLRSRCPLCVRSALGPLPSALGPRPSALCPLPSALTKAILHLACALILRKLVIGIAIHPSLARFGRRDDRMPARPRVPFL